MEKFLVVVRAVVTNYTPLVALVAFMAVCSIAGAQTDPIEIPAVIDFEGYRDAFLDMLTTVAGYGLTLLLGVLGVRMMLKWLRKSA